MNILIGVDIGGTNIAVAALTREGEVLARVGGPTLAERGPADGMRRILALIREAQAQAGGGEIAGVGIGATGPINRETGRIQNPFTLPTWDDVPIVDTLHGELGVPVVMENDAHAAALGEYWRGAGQGTQHMIYLTVGTGVGGGLILGGRLHTGAGGIAGEVGHLPVDLAGPECYCGGRGCVEAIASAPGMIRQAQQHPDLLHSAILALVGGDREAISAKIIADAARQGDGIAQAILERAGTALGLGLCGLIVVLAPERIVMGGGVMASFDLLHPIIERTVQRISGYVPVPPIVPASLGLNAGVTGAVRALIERAFN